MALKKHVLRVDFRGNAWWFKL